MYKKIVVGYDGTERALRAVDEAAKIATAFESTLHIVSAVSKDDKHEFGGGTDHMVKSDVEIAEAGLKKLKGRFDHLTVTTGAAAGPPGRVLLNEAEAVKADLIVVGNRGAQGIGRVLGSVASTVAANAKCAVLIAQTSDKVAGAS